jgi:hypothetical protein
MISYFYSVEGKHAHMFHDAGARAYIYQGESLRTYEFQIILPEIMCL